MMQKSRVLNYLNNTILDKLNKHHPSDRIGNFLQNPFW